MRTFVAFALSLLFANQILGEIVLDFSPDTSTDGFFGRNLIAKSAIEKAADDINRFLNTPLFALDSRNTIDGNFGETTTFLEWKLNYQDPSTGQDVELTPVVLQENEFRIFVGMSELTGDIAGFGGPGSVGFAAGAAGLPEEIAEAVEQLETTANELLGRGGGPIMSTISFDNFFDTGRSLDISVGPTIGQLTLDIDRDDNGQADTDAMLAEQWHFDPTTPVADGKTDLYSVALHEMIHALGFGGSQGWSNLISAGDWLGENGIAANGGSGAQLVVNGHVNSNIISNRISDGQAQNPLMNPAIREGTRAELTEMDLALLADLGWNFDINESLLGDFDEDGILDVDDVNLLIENVGMAAEKFDLTQDGIVDAADVNSWVRDLKNTWLGDANLDGEFNSTDLVFVFEASKFETGLAAGWQEGDWDGDGRFTTSDFVLSFGDAGFEQGPRPIYSVPEPDVLLVPLIFAFVFFRKSYAER